MKKIGYIFGVFVLVLVAATIFFMTSKSMQCSYPGCDKRRESGSAYCHEHKPDSEEEENKKEESKKEESETASAVPSTETESVLCKELQCTNERKEGSKYCDIHTCHKVGCNDGALTGGKFCYTHTCRQTGCFNVIISGSYCSEHFPKSPVRKTYSGSADKKTYSGGIGWQSNSSGKSSSGKKSSGTKREDPYHARDYGDVEDFYYDYFDDFESFDDAETYFEDVRDE